jgi:hypothetical protein
MAELPGNDRHWHHPDAGLERGAERRVPWERLRDLARQPARSLSRMRRENHQPFSALWRFEKNRSAPARRSSGQRPCSCRRSYEGRARSSGTPSRYRDPPEGHRSGGGHRDRSSPPVISSKPAIIRSVVVLPHPEGPRRTTNSPSWMESDTSLTAATVSKFLLRFSKSNSPNGCSPRLLPAIRELWGQGARRTPLVSQPVYYWCLTARNQSAQSLQDRPPLYH